jgi:hypothetical protein
MINLMNQKSFDDSSAMRVVVMETWLPKLDDYKRTQGERVKSTQLDRARVFCWEGNTVL